ncbi:anaphase-promoting complex subunit Apc11 [Obelidium mucronatum]|nr:anaphase-promoting complex subunit Apc11 [Obelidium mucronatum]
MKVKINSWRGVAVWRWETSHGADDGDEDDVCGICRAPFDGCCPDCRVPGDDCSIVIGECKHVFHMHCLFKWIASENSKQLCPMDRTPWKLAST